MGLWSKGLERAQTGEERLEDILLNRNVLDRICKYVDGIRVHYDHMLKQDSYGYKCTYKTNDRFVDFRIFGINISFYVPEGKDNICWMMQTIMIHILPFKNHKTGIKVLYDAICTNQMKARIWDDEDFLEYPIML